MFTGQKYVVIGLGKSGVGAVRLLLNRGARVLALDEDPDAEKPLEHPDIEL